MEIATKTNEFDYIYKFRKYSKHILIRFGIHSLRCEWRIYWRKYLQYDDHRNVVLFRSAIKQTKQRKNTGNDEEKKQKTK